MAVLIVAMLLGGCVVSVTENGKPLPEVSKDKVLDSQVALALRYTGSGNREMAIKHLRKALEIDPHSAGAHFGFAVLYQGQGESELAEKYYRDAIKYDSSYTLAGFYYGDFLAQQGRYEDAYQQFERVTQDVDFQHRARAFVSLGIIALKINKQSEAVVFFDKAIRLDVNQWLAYLELAEMAYNSADFDAAQLNLSKFEKLSKVQQITKPSARSLWLGVRLGNHFKDRNAEASYGLALRNMFPNSKENLAYQEWQKNEQQ